MVVEALRFLKKPGRALDLGCGDGKHIVFLERRGWVVDGVDVSAAAREAFRQRCRIDGWRHRGRYILGDARRPTGLQGRRYDLVICYGLAHCLERPSALAEVVSVAARTLVKRGLFAFAALNDRRELPDGHGTEGLKLQSHLSYPSQLRSRLRIRGVLDGVIKEDHLPVIGCHWHSVTWILARKGR
jgi:SAM-dependent methyltransferase